MINAVPPLWGTGDGCRYAKDSLGSGVCRAGTEKFQEVGELNLKEALSDYCPQDLEGNRPVRHGH